MQCYTLTFSTKTSAIACHAYDLQWLRCPQCPPTCVHTPQALTRDSTVLTDVALTYVCTDTRCLFNLSWLMVSLIFDQQGARPQLQQPPAPPASSPQAPAPAAPAPLLATSYPISSNSASLGIVASQDVPSSLESDPSLEVPNDGQLATPKVGARSWPCWLLVGCILASGTSFDITMGCSVDPCHPVQCYSVKWRSFTSDAYNTPSISCLPDPNQSGRRWIWILLALQVLKDFAEILRR